MIASKAWSPPREIQDTAEWRTPKAAPNYQVHPAQRVRRRTTFQGTYAGYEKQWEIDGRGERIVRLPVVNGGEWFWFYLDELIVDAWGGPQAPHHGPTDDRPKPHRPHPSFTRPRG